MTKIFNFRVLSSDPEARLKPRASRWHGFSNQKSGFRGVRGFTLIEVLVVLGIIAVVAGLIIALSNVMGQDAAKRRTTITLANLKAIADEWRAVTGAAVPRTIPSGAPAEVDSSMKAFVYTVQQNEMTERMLHGLQKDVYTRDKYLVVDGWGNQLLYLDKQVLGDGETVQLSTTVTPLDDIFPPWSQPYFASAGPDGAWGDVRTTASATLQDQAKDNLYSYEMN